MRRIPNFVLLRAFEAAARLESFALAAQELHRTPSAISHQIRELEQYFGCPLFLRANRRVEPTPQARRLLDSLSRVFDVVEAACQEVALEPQAQVLAVHCSPSLATQWLGPRLADFARAHADVAIRLSTGAEPLDLSRVREVDVAISYGHALERAELQNWPLGNERIAPLCAPNLLQDAPSPRSNQRRVAELISRLPLIESQLSPVNWSEWFGACGLQPRAGIRASFDRAALGISAAVDGMGVVLESTRLAERELRRGELVELTAPGLPVFERSLHFLSCRRGEAAQPRIAAFRDWLLAQAAAADASAA
ncbi:MAG: LysR family transcriptional regulator [Betaproteobacteria bacterium]|nr:LysR family transcriptional regulator [Betaproteobacteria bacterium]